MEGSTLRGKFLTQEHNTMTGSALEPRSLHLELSVLTTLVPCLKMRRKKIELNSFIIMKWNCALINKLQPFPYHLARVTIKAETPSEQQATSAEDGEVCKNLRTVQQNTITLS